MNYFVCFVIAAAVAGAVDVNKDEAEKNSGKKQTDESNASGFTQDNCNRFSQYYVATLPSFRNGETWPCSYAGTLPSNEDGSHHLFFWIYPAYSASAPVVIWLNGGPGASSTFANFLFNSPLRIAQPTASTYDLYTSDDTWIA